MQSRIVAATACLLLVAVGSNAQDVASSLDQLRVLVRPGDVLTVTAATGEEIRGTILDLTSSSLVMKTGGRRRELPAIDIQRITQRTNADLATGARWGFGTGAGLALLAMASTLGSCSRECTPFYVMSTLAFGGIGAGVGVGVSALIIRQEPVFERANTPWTLNVGPLFDREHQGIRVSVRF